HAGAQTIFSFQSVPGQGSVAGSVMLLIATSRPCGHVARFRVWVPDANFSVLGGLVSAVDREQCRNGQCQPQTDNKERWHLHSISLCAGKLLTHPKKLPQVQVEKRARTSSGTRVGFPLVESTGTQTVRALARSWPSPRWISVKRSNLRRAARPTQ